MLSAEIIAVGTELLTPTKTDTNSLWLTEKLNEIGIEVKLKTVVGDDEARLEETFKDALRRSDVVISTGGLGPTEDDVTRQVAARAVGRELVYRAEVAAEIEEKFRRMKREMPEINKRQAFVIEGADVLPNPNGSAPGMLFETGGKFFVVLPGPPRELKPMFETQILPKLREKAGEISVRRRILRVAGMGESAVDEAIAPIYLKYKNPQTTILFSRSEIEIHLTAQAATEPEAELLLEEVAEKIAERLGIAVFSTNGETMEQVVGNLLTLKNKTLAIAESCTGGLIGERVTEVAGASRYFIEGVVAYANEAKIRNLNVPRELIEKHGAVSVEVAEAMARGVRERAATDFGISVTGVAGPEGGTAEKPVGLVFIGFSSQSETKSIKINLPGDRYLIRWRASQAALDFLRREMQKIMNDILNKLKTPAICLIIVGALNALTSILVLMGGVARFAGVSGTETLPARDAERFGFYVGTFLTYGSGLLALVVAPLIIYGAIRMMKGKNYGLARASAILAIVPFTSCCFLAGIPIGIWALIVLGKPEVKAVFTGDKLPPNFNPPQPPPSF